jgi:uncharacterized protein (DUF433 family)
MIEQNGYQYLEPWPNACTSNRGLFFKGRRLRAEDVYRETVGRESRTPEEVANDFDVPLDALREAIDYCTRHADFLREEGERELAQIREYEKRYPSPVPPDSRPA